MTRQEGKIDTNFEKRDFFFSNTTYQEIMLDLVEPAGEN